jgi:hypothetical protein
MTRDPQKRLGCSPSGQRDIMAHPFFKSIVWTDLAAKKVPPPFLPSVKSPLEASNFDEEFVSAKPNLTPPERESKALLDAVDPDEFLNFTFVNPSFFV